MKRINFITFLVTSSFVLITFHIHVRPSWSEKNFSRLVYPNKDGKLVYTPDEKGNVIPDFSHCGYMGGGVALPDVPVVMTMIPQVEGDDTKRIQSKIDDLSQKEMNASGFRGTLLFKKGVYRISRTLEVRASGIVLRGEGDNEDETVLVAAGKEKITLINVTGHGGRAREVHGTRQIITDEYIPVGKRKFSVTDASDFMIGDQIIVHRPSTLEWIESIGMNRIRSIKPGVIQWKPGEYDLKFD